MNTKLYLKSFVGALLLTVIYVAFNALLGLTNSWSISLWSILSNYMVTLLLAYYILHSSRSGIRLILEIFLIYFLIGHFNILIEALIFNVTTRSQTALQLLQGFLVAAIFSPLYTYMVRNESSVAHQSIPSRSVFSWTWRVLAADFLYLLCYLIAGMTLSLLYPRLIEFYEGKLPPMGTIILTQLLIRGFIFIGIALLMLQSLNGSLLKKAVLTGLTFSILGGIAPLIQPNEFMPAYVRFGHGLEVGISNFVFGLLLCYLLGKNKGRAATVQA